MSAPPPLPGFAEPVFEAQRTFRCLLDAMARPGTLGRIETGLAPVPPLSVAAAALALTLFDATTAVWLDRRAGSPEALRFLAFHCGCPLAAAPDEAAFALIAGAMPSLAAFHPGDALYPDSSATLILDVPALAGGGEVALRGPGIAGRAKVAPRVAPSFWRQMAENHARFPLGVDVVLCSGAALLGLPRSVAVEV